MVTEKLCDPAMVSRAAKPVLDPVRLTVGFVSMVAVNVAVCDATLLVSVRVTTTVQLPLGGRAAVQVLPLRL